MDADSLVEENKASKEGMQDGEDLRVSLEDRIKALKKELYDLKNAPQGPRQSESESTPSMSNALDSTTDSTTSNSGTISINLDTALTDSVPATTTTTISTTSATSGIATVNKDSTTTTTTSGCYNAVSPVASTSPIDYSQKDEQKGVAEKVNKTTATLGPTNSRFDTMASPIDKTAIVPVNDGSIATAKLHKDQPPFLDLNAAATNATLAKIGLQEIEKVLQSTDTNRAISTSAKTLHSRTNILNDGEQGGGERDDFSPPPYIHSPISFSVNSPIFLASDSSRNERQQGEQKGVAEKVTKTTESNVRKAVPGRPRIIILPATAATGRPPLSRFTTSAIVTLTKKSTTVLVNSGSIATKFEVQQDGNDATTLADSSRNEMQHDEQNGTDATTSDDIDIIDQKPSLSSLQALSYSSTSKGIDNTMMAATEDGRMSTDTSSVADVPDLLSKRNAVLKQLEQLDTAIQSIKRGNNAKADSVRPPKRKKKVSTLGTSNGQGSKKPPRAEKKPYDCSTCGETFTLKSALNRHMKTHVIKCDKPDSCPTCGKAFLYKSKLAEHIEEHKGETQCKCYVCGKQYLLSEDLKIHMVSHTGEKPQACNVCGLTFTTKSALNSHYTTIHGGIRHKCPICGKMYAAVYSLDVHIRSHTGEKPYQCAFCGKGFAAKAKHAQHVKLHGEKLEICSICGKGFRRLDYLRIHMRTHTGEKPYGCTTCGKAFTVKSALNNHIRVHTGETPHACSICGKAFAQLGTLQQHFRIHTGVKPYLCSTCGKSFASGSAYRVHKRIHTGLKPYKCPICGKAFATSTNLYVHKIVHSGERPFVCTACGKAFMFKSHLKRHAKVHAKVRGNEFTSWS